MEQLVARQAHNLEVEGSSPSPATNAPLAQLAEQRTCIHGVNHDKNQDYMKWAEMY